MKRTFLFLFVSAVSAFPQMFQAGVKAGVPLTDFVNTVQSPRLGFNSNTKRYIIGPMVQVGLPAGFAVEFDALYRRLNYESNSSLVDVMTNTRTTGNAWEVPLVLKYRFLHTPIVKPYVEAGVAWDTLSGMKQSITNTIFPNRTTTTTTGNPAELRNSTTTGFVVGGGVDIHVLLHISPEVRYTHWGAEHFRDTVNGLLHSNQNQAEFLVGFTF
jgi:opacity protein-like surface antigen